MGTNKTGRVGKHKVNGRKIALTEVGIADEIIKEREFEEGQQVATVSVQYKRTVNLGNYESAQVGVSVSLPCLPTDADMKAALQEAHELASLHIRTQLKKTTGNGVSK